MFIYSLFPASLRLIPVPLALMLFACNGGSLSDQAYEGCVQETIDGINEKNRGNLPPGLTDKQLRKLADAACRIVKTECEKDPEGAVCQALLNKYE